MLAGIVLLSLAAVVCVCLFLPLEIALRLDIGGGVKFSILLLWLSGVLRKELRWKSGAGAARQPIEDSHRLEDAVQLFSGILRAKGLPIQLLRLAGNCLKRLKVEEFVARLKIGLDSPADTGLLFAYLSPLGLLGLFPRCRIDLEPSFSGDAIVQGYLSARVKTEPARLIIPVTGFVLSPLAIKAWAKLVQSRWKGK